MRHGKQRITTRQRYWLDHLKAVLQGTQRIMAMTEASTDEDLKCLFITLSFNSGL
jgi:hypothetical protein